MCWPLRELLIAFLQLLHQQAIDEYRHEGLLYTIRQVNSRKRLKPPARPRFLRVRE